MAGALPALLTDLDLLLSMAASLPLDTLAAEAEGLVSATTGLLTSPDVSAIPLQINGLILDVRALLASDAIQAAPESLRAALQTLERLFADLAAGGSIARLEATLASAQSNARGVAATLPDLLGDIDTFLGQATALPLDALAAEAGATLAAANGLLSAPAAEAVLPTAQALLVDLRTLLASDAVQAAPQELEDALSQLADILTGFEAGGGTDDLLAALNDARQAAGNVNTASAALPALADELTRLTNSAADLPLEALVTAARNFIGTADDLLASDGARALPETLNATLDRARALLASLDEGGAVTNLNSALSSAATASDVIAAAAGDLPELARRLSNLADQAALTLRAYNSESNFNYDTRAALREIREAAEAVTSLSRAIERRPNSILIGR